VGFAAALSSFCPPQGVRRDWAGQGTPHSYRYTACERLRVLQGSLGQYTESTSSRLALLPIHRDPIPGPNTVAWGT
jgi:hypothetical protein